MINRKEIQAQDLKVGQKLATGEVVTHSPSRGIKTPTGKVDLGINGFRKTWNARTSITVVVDETVNA